ncbi:PQQ-binding-like beta-propeller repeat protein [Candidatus Woesearchaeota archaeon]|nr:PQQ-binding-like beta-propeller repeat protein [Candidatus Woesearchaeota archaeon]
MGFFSELVSKIGGGKTGTITQSWEFDTKSSLLSSAACADIDYDGKEEIIVGTKDGQIYCLAHDGSLRWMQKLEAAVGAMEAMFLEKEALNSIYAVPLATEFINGGKRFLIIIAAENGLVSALSNEGKVLWQFKAKGAVRGQPLVADIDNNKKQEIIFGSRDKFLYVLNQEGGLLWQYEAESPLEGSPAFYATKDKTQLIFGTNDGFITSLTPEGKANWKYKTGGRIGAKPIIADIFGNNKPLILVCSEDTFLYVLDENGNLVWKFQAQGRLYTQATVTDVDDDKEMEIFFGSGDDKVYALSPNSQKMWTYETNFWVVAPVLVADIDNDNRPEVIAGSYDKSVYVLDALGTFSLDYMPGISAIAYQPGHTSEVVTQEPGKLVGTKLWQYHTDGVITGLALHKTDGKKNIIVSTKEGKLLCLTHTR